MLTFKGHYDGTAIVLDEPADLTVGQAVQIVVEPVPPQADRLDEPWKGKVHFVKDVDDIIEQHWDEYYKEITP